MNNIESVRAIYEAFGRQDVPSILARLSADVSWDAVYGEHEVPWIRARRGPAGVGEFFGTLMGLEFEHFAVTRVLGDGDMVVALIDLDATVKATGKKIRERGEVHIWRFDDAGKVIAFRHVVDTLQHQRALHA